MRKIFFFFAFVSILLITGAIVAFVKGYYPVASVNGKAISAREWIRMQEGVLQSISEQVRAAGGSPIDFAAQEGRDLIEEVRKNTLAVFIEDVLVEENGVSLVDDFVQNVGKKISEATAGHGNIAQAAQAAYGYTMDEFSQFILLPQARRDAIAEKLKEKGEQFDAWLDALKKNADVKLYFVPFQWDGKEIK